MVVQRPCVGYRKFSLFIQKRSVWRCKFVFFCKLIRVSLKPRFPKKHILICKSLSLGPRNSETTWLHAAEQSMELWRAPFQDASCWEMAGPLFSRPTSPWARVPAVSTLKKHISLPGSIFLSILQALEATVTIPALAGPALSASPLSNPTEPGWGWSCHCTARKHAAATIIALIARFFCWAEISSGATILLLKTPQNLQVKMEGRG